MSLQGKNVIITGTNRGIGNELVREFAEKGANIWAHARKQNTEFEIEMHELADKNHVDIIPVYFDMSDSGAMKRAVMEIWKEKRHIDILINNAGIAHGGLFQMTSIKEIKDVFEINLFSLMELTQLVLRFMTKQKSGSIVNIASISGLELAVGNCAYGVSKAGVIAFTKTLSKEVASLGIRVNAVAPGLANTDMAKLMEEKAGKAMVRNTAFNRLAKPGEIAKAVMFLASDDASFITGQVLRVDGGM
jgi:Dehydrogenases with different specificities (related to short-chain alcohol dehydrogenases)